jgi:hypothetical protein
MSIVAILTAAKANADTILAVWLVLEQLLAANKKIKANSTFQLVSNLVGNVLKKNATKK